MLRWSSSRRKPSDRISRAWQTERVTQTRKPAVARGFAASSLSIFIALAGHVWGGGSMPGALGILVPWILASMVCVLLAGRKLSVMRLSVSVALSQFLFHLLFVLGAITPSGAAVPHVHGAPLVLPPSTGLSAAVVADSSMWIAHGFAALVTIAALHRGERLVLAVRELAAFAVQWLRRRVDAALVPPAIQASTTRGDFRTAPSATSALLATLRGRGPPARPAFLI